MPEADLARRRADIRRSLLRVGAAGLVVVLVVVGLAIAAVLAAFRSQDNARRAQAATTRAEEELRNSYIAQARAGRLSAVMGSRWTGRSPRGLRERTGLGPLGGSASPGYRALRLAARI